MPPFLAEFYTDARRHRSNDVSLIRHRAGGVMTGSWTILEAHRADLIGERLASLGEVIDSFSVNLLAPSVGR